MALCAIALSLGGDVVVQAQTPRRIISDRSALVDPMSWEPVAVQLVVPDGSGAVTRTEVVGRTVSYRPPTAQYVIRLVAIEDPHARHIYIAQGGQSFYLSDERGLTTVLVGVGNIRLTRAHFCSKFERFDSALLGEFADAFDDTTLATANREASSVRLSAFVPLDFFTSLPKGSSGGASPSIDGIDVQGRQIQLTLRSPHGYQGVFLIDLDAGELLEASVDGVVTFPQP